MKKLTVLLLLGAVVLASCAAPISSPASRSQIDDVRGVRYFHDEVHQVSCWTNWTDGIYCLPDSMVANPGQPVMGEQTLRSE